MEKRELRTDKRSLLNDILATIERRRHVRYYLDADVRVESARVGLIPGQSFEISESGISILLPVELPLKDIVKLEFKLPLGYAEATAIVRDRTAFRHGLEFLAPNPARQLIRDSCLHLTPCPYHP